MGYPFTMFSAQPARTRSSPFGEHNYNPSVGYLLRVLLHLNPGPSDFTAIANGIIVAQANDARPADLSCSPLFAALSGMRVSGQKKEPTMLRKYWSCLLAVLILIVPASRVAARTQQMTADQAKIEVAKIGLGEKARATITLKSGTKVKGYVSRADENDFVIRDRKSDTPTTINYADVAKVQKNRGHSTARNLAIGIGIGAGAFLAILLIAISHLD